MADLFVVRFLEHVYLDYVLINRIGHESIRPPTTSGSFLGLTKFVGLVVYLYLLFLSYNLCDGPEPMLSVPSCVLFPPSLFFFCGRRSWQMLLIRRRLQTSLSFVIRISSVLDPHPPPPPPTWLSTVAFFRSFDVSANKAKPFSTFSVARDPLTNSSFHTGCLRVMAIPVFYS